MPYLGKTPSQATRQRYYLTASGGETSISGTMTTGGTLTFNDGEFVDVSVNGVALVAGTDYNTTTANTIGGLSALTASDQVEIVVYDTFSVFGGNVDGDFNLNNGSMTITTADNDAQLVLKSTDADASAGPLIKMHRDSSSPADGDALGRFNFIGENDADEEVTYARIHAKANDVTDGTEDGELLLLTTVAGTNRSRMAIGPSETVFNEDSVDVDFRVEGNGNANMLFVDAGNDRVGIGTNSPGGSLEIYKAGTSEVLIGSDNGGTAQLSLYENDDGTKEGLLKYDGTNNRIHLATSGDANALVMPRDTGYVGLGTTDFTTQNGSVSRLLKLGGANNTVIAAEQTGSGKNFILEARNEGRSGGDRYAQMSFAEDGSDNGAIIFYTASSGSDVSERMRIVSDGRIYFQKTDENAQSDGFEFHPSAGIVATGSAAVVGVFNRKTNDGTIVQFRQDNTTEGTITVSGSTVSYNGGHLERW
mgnify:CR=1 FL=1